MLRPRQKAILEFIRSFRANHAFGPTRNEIVGHVRLSSTSVCQYNLQELRRQGLVTWVDGQARTLEVVRHVAPRPVCPRCGNSERFTVAVPCLARFEWLNSSGWSGGEGVFCRAPEREMPAAVATPGQPYHLSCQSCRNEFECLPWS